MDLAAVVKRPTTFRAVNTKFIYLLGRIINIYFKYLKTFSLTQALLYKLFDGILSSYNLLLILARAEEAGA